MFGNKITIVWRNSTIRGQHKPLYYKEPSKLMGHRVELKIKIKKTDNFIHYCAINLELD